MLPISSLSSDQVPGDNRPLLTEVQVMTLKRGQAGFTLVEIAIVLVIIGLLIGGILKGQQLITNAKISTIEDDYKSISAAILAYQDRYGVLPGDDPAASTRFGGTWSSADDGNGDGVITGNWDSTTNTDESRLIWKHLRGAGFIKGPVDSSDAAYRQPTHAFGGKIGYQDGMYNVDDHAIVFGNIAGDIAAILEVRGDDGNSSTGDIQGHATDTTYTATTRYDLAFEN